MELEKIINIIYKKLLKVKSSETILIICDNKTKKIAERFFEYGFIYGKHTLCFEIPEGKTHGEEPPKEIAKLFCRYDILLLITTKSLSHTNARKKATLKGARIITMPGITEKILERCVDIDYNSLNKLHVKLQKLMCKANNIRIITEKGTDIKFKIYNNKIEYKSTLHKKKDFHNIPLGEVYVSPIEGTANGTIIIDGSMAGVGKTNNNIKITVKNGIATQIQGETEAKQLNEILKKVNNKKAYNIAEFGIGTNPKAKITGMLLEDEKVMGTCHIALGNNYSFGGKVNVPIHLDGIIKKPTIYFDDKEIMKNGKFKI
jgi:aminopeptidase